MYGILVIPAGLTPDYSTVQYSIFCGKLTVLYCTVLYVQGWGKNMATSQETTRRQQACNLWLGFGFWALVEFACLTVKGRSRDGLVRGCSGSTVLQHCISCILYPIHDFQYSIALYRRSHASELTTRVTLRACHDTRVVWESCVFEATSSVFALGVCMFAPRMIICPPPGVSDVPKCTDHVNIITKVYILSSP